MVWQKTLATYHDCVAAEGWDQMSTIDAPRVQQYTFKVRLLFSLGLFCQITHQIKLALLVISACGFGISYSWSEPPTSKRPDGTEAMSMQEALRIVSETISLATFAPKWLKALPLKEYVNP